MISPKRPATARFLGKGLAKEMSAFKNEQLNHLNKQEEVMLRVEKPIDEILFLIKSININVTDNASSNSPPFSENKELLLSNAEQILLKLKQSPMSSTQKNFFLWPLAANHPKK